MANKKLKVGGGSDLKLPAKKAKGEKKPKWQGKTGKDKARVEEVVVAEPTEQGVDTPAPAAEEPTPAIEQLEEETTQESSVQEPVPEPAPISVQTTDDPAPASAPEPAPKKSKKLKVKAEITPKKMSMMAAALQVLQDRKVPMTCPR